MPPAYDLHAHSLHSDGTLTPTELVTRAHANGVTTLALTDHDVTDGLAEAQVAGEKLGLRLLPGVEISVTWERETLHIVGLAIDPANAALQQGLAGIREQRNWRAQEIDRRLRKKNIEGAYDYVRQLARGAILSRTHFAQFLVTHGFVRDSKQAFKQYLGQGRPAHVSGQWARLDEAVGWICGAGGIAVLAHPARYRVSSGKLKKLLREFIDCGGRAIEVISGSHGPADTERFAQIACEYGLLGSVGSDYHGPEKSWADLGRLAMLPAAVTPVWSAFEGTVNA
ncbi:MAG: PHP domain-containing protein [Gammaproteobacteria bacterium]|nr:PHP domain-containing protein [Gammaproteobacteria bacterium]